MWATIARIAGGVFSGLQSYLIVGAVSGVMAAAGGFYVAHKMGQADILGMQARMAAARFKAISDAEVEQKRLDRIGIDAALSLDHQILTIEIGNVNLVREIERHVTIKSIACVPYGLVRVLDAAVFGSSAESLALPAGTADDTCAPVNAVTLAESISANYATARENAAQLDALISAVRASKLRDQ